MFLPVHTANPISVIIPCFNRADCIADAIESVLADAPEAELIVIDDGSSDDSWTVINNFGGLTTRKTANRGVSAARNLGVQLATRPFLRFLDSDDRFPPGSTAKLLRWASSEEAPVGLADQGTYGFPDVTDGASIPLRELFGRTLPMGLVLLPRERVVAAGGFNERLTIGEDQEFAVRLAKGGLQFRRIDELVYSVGDKASARVTRASPTTAYEAHLKAITALAQLAATEEERQSLGRLAWRLGRAASIDRLPSQAETFFAVARRHGGTGVQHGPRPLMALYGLFHPYRAERIFASAKRLVLG